MGAGTRFDLVGQYAVVRGFPWSLPEITARQKKAGAPINLTGYQAVLEIFDSTQTAAAPLVYSQQTGHIPALNSSGVITCDLSIVDVAALPAYPTYRLSLIDSLGRPRPYLRGRLSVIVD